MVKNEIIVASVVSHGLGVRATATEYGVVRRRIVEDLVRRHDTP